MMHQTLFIAMACLLLSIIPISMIITKKEKDNCLVGHTESVTMYQPALKMIQTYPKFVCDVKK